jgi:hypothetical protein
LHFNVFPEALSAQLGKLATPQPPLVATTVIRGVTGRSAEVTVKEPARPLTVNFTRPAETADFLWTITLAIPDGGAELLLR